MSQWFFHTPADNQRHGPLDEAAAQAFAQRTPGALAWREGMREWKPVRELPELAGAATPPPHLPPLPGAGGRRGADEIDFRIVGHEMQFVEVELDPGESAIAEAGALMFKDSAVQMDTVFGDGSHSGQGGGLMDKLFSAGKRVLTGESLFTTMYTHTGQGKAKVAFASPTPGAILPLNLGDLGGSLICQKDSFLAAAKGVSIGLHFQKRVMTGLFGGEGFIMQRLDGDGWVFVQMGGALVERDLAPGEQIHVDTGCVAAYSPTVDFDLVAAGGVKSVFFGGEGLFFARLTGPGKVWIQSLPFSRLAGRMLQAAGGGGQNAGEGSVLGGLGNLIGGNN